MPSPFNISDNLPFDNSTVHIEVQKGSRLHHREARLIPEKHERTSHTPGAALGNSVIRAHHTIILTDTKCNHSE